MNNNTKIIDKQEDYEVIDSLLTKAFHLERRFPEQVFSQTYNSFFFEEFDWAMSSKFWDTLKELTSIAQDSYVIIGVLDPSPVNYFYSEFGRYNWFELSVNISADEYWKVLLQDPKDSPADAMLYNSEVVFWLSSSLKWVIWGERSHGVCAIAFARYNELEAALPILNSWKNVNEAFGGNMTNRQYATEFLNSLYTSYRIR